MVEPERVGYAIPTCYACLPPPEPLPVRHRVGTLGNPYKAVLLVPHKLFVADPVKYVRAADAYRCVRVVRTDGGHLSIYSQHYAL